MGNYKSEIGKRVSYLRNMNGLTQENLAELLDCSVKHVSSAERGAALFPWKNISFSVITFSAASITCLRETLPKTFHLPFPSIFWKSLRGMTVKSGSFCYHI